MGIHMRKEGLLIFKLRRNLVPVDSGQGQGRLIPVEDKRRDEALT
jgi:hypothetical protein